MLKKSVTLWATAVMAAALLVGCGGGGDDGPVAPTADISTSASDLVAFLQSLIAGTSETGDPIDIQPLVLVADDRAEPSPL